MTGTEHDPPVPDPPGRRRPGPVYDDAMKILADADLGAVLSVVGVDGGSAERLNVELAGSATKADLLARTASGIVHVEFVKDPAPDLDLRMVDYRLRLRRRDRLASIRQYVLVLREVAVPDRYVDVDADQLACRWTVVRVAERDPTVLLANPTTAALAALTAGTARQRATVLAAAAELITAHAEPERRDVLLGAAATLASIVLPRRTIVEALKEATMPVPVRDTPLGRELFEEGWQEGRQEGRQEGDRAAVVRLTLFMLRQRFGEDPRSEAVAEALADLTDEERFGRLDAARQLDDLAR
jgi:predicted transposase YdaD